MQSPGDSASTSSRIGIGLSPMWTISQVFESRAALIASLRFAQPCSPSPMMFAVARILTPMATSRFRSIVATTPSGSA